jgi:hypothetical protein
MLFAAGLLDGACPELWNATHPEVVRGIHRGYYDAGSDFVETNTFGGTRMKLDHYGVGERTRELNVRGAQLARSVCPPGHYVAGSIGPTSHRGLRRSAGGWEGLAALRRGRERWAFDERILGSGAFVEHMREAAAPIPQPARALRALPGLIARLAGVFGVSPAEMTNGSRRRPVAQARAAVSSVAVTGLALPGARVARALGVTPMAIWRGVARGPAALRAHGLDLHRLAREALRKVD